MLVASVAAGLILATTSTAHAQETPNSHCKRGYMGGTHCVVEDGYTFTYDRRARVFRESASAFSVKDGPKARWEVTSTPYCSGNVSGLKIVADNMCTAALRGCPQGETRVYQLWTPVGFPAAVQPRLDDACLGAPREVSLAAVTAAVREELEKRLARPVVRLQPKVGLVHLPVIASTRADPPTGFAITRPLPGAVRAEPGYEWDFGGGMLASGPGRPYDGTNPLEDTGYYVSAPYEQTGERVVRLAVTWRATVQVGGLAPIPLDDIVFTADASIRVLQARSQLIAEEVE